MKQERLDFLMGKDLRANACPWLFAELANRRATAKEEEIVEIADQVWKRWNANLPAAMQQEKPRVRVFRQGEWRQKYVLRIGGRYAASFTWFGLLKKLAWQDFRRFRGGAIEKRWYETPKGAKK